jgi:hypothetical protein
VCGAAAGRPAGRSDRGGTFGADRALVLDARAAGVGVAAVAAWRRAPFPVVIVLAAVVTAALRAWG